VKINPLNHNVPTVNRFSKLDIKEFTEDNIGIINNYIFNSLLLPLEKKEKKNFLDRKNIRFYQSVIKEIKSKESYKECLTNCLIRKSTVKFINSRILPEMKLKELTNENYSDVCDYISDNYEVPLFNRMKRAVFHHKRILF
jgi:hypothetical protein